jgi:hypothetical protein
MDQQQLEWLRSVRDYTDGVRGYGGYATPGPSLHPIDQSLRKLGYVAGMLNRTSASVVTESGRAFLAQVDTDQPPASGL